MVERAPAISGYIQIFESIVVVITDCNAGGVAEATETCVFRDIFKGSIRLLVIEPIPELRTVLLRNRAFCGRIVETRTVGEKDVETAIVVVIEQSYARAHRLQKIFLAGWRSLLAEVNSQFFRDIDETPRRGGVWGRRESKSKSRRIKPAIQAIFVNIAREENLKRLFVMLGSSGRIRPV